jgi:O-antigen ligase
MRTANRLGIPTPSLNFALLVGLLSILFLAGGASRADAAGQIFVRAASWLCLLTAFLFGRRPSLDSGRMACIFLAAAILLALIQLVPLPPSLWTSLPGRDVLRAAAGINEGVQPWRPWSMAPTMTINALSSLAVPAAVLYLLLTLDHGEWRRMPGLCLIMIIASAVMGALQASGATFDNPLINESVGFVSGNFANRNHFALFLALGCVLAPVWAFFDGRRPGWRALAALGLIMVFALEILASGSRAGLLVGALALAVAPLIVWRSVKRVLAGQPRWVFAALISAAVAVVVIAVLLSISVDRAESINRALVIDPGQDMRGRGLPVVLAMIHDYFPWGSGLGGFDPIFRLHEPLDLLKPTYFNHAHNDFIEIVLDTGVFGLLFLLAGLGWWALAGVRAWRGGSRQALPRLGATMLLLVIIASVFDYPARTPMIMAMMMIAAVWLGERPEECGSFTLPDTDRHL